MPSKSSKNNELSATLPYFNIAKIVKKSKSKQQLHLKNLFVAKIECLCCKNKTDIA